MGNPRPRPLRLAEKLLQIRNGLGLSQTQMLERLGARKVFFDDTQAFANVNTREDLAAVQARARRAGR